MLISKKYRKMNAEMHEDLLGYGANGWMWIGPIIHFMRMLSCKTLLDYGAGKATLAAWMPKEYPVVNYDPVTFPDDPPAQDFVVCLDVLEHIEPELLDNVLHHLHDKTKVAAFVVISLREAKKVLSDGRNAHLIVQPAQFWYDKFNTLFRKVEHVAIGRMDELVLVAVR